MTTITCYPCVEQHDCSLAGLQLSNVCLINDRKQSCVSHFTVHLAIDYHPFITYSDEMIITFYKFGALVCSFFRHWHSHTNSNVFSLHFLSQPQPNHLH